MSTRQYLSKRNQTSLYSTNREGSCLMLIYILLFFCASFSYAVDSSPNGAFETFGQKLLDKAHVIYVVNNDIVTAPTIENGKVLLRTQSGLEVFELRISKELWSYQTEVKIKMKPLVLNGTVFLIEGKNTLSALDIETGKKIWEKTVGLMAPGCEPIVYQGKIYLATTRKAYALDVKSGGTIWCIDDGPFATNPVLKNDRIIICNAKGAILQIGSESGRVLTKEKLKYTDLGPKVIDGDNLYYYGFRFPKPKSIKEAIVCLNTTEGNIIWQVPFDRQLYVASYKLHLWKNHLYFFAELKTEMGSSKKKLFLWKMALESGETLWSVGFDNATIDVIEPVFQKKLLFFSEGSCVYAVSTENGEVLSKWEGEKVSPVAIDKGKVFWGDGREIFALELDNSK